MIHPLKITSTLADDTRYQIYEYMLQEKKTMTVQHIADRFGIHPNVARLHLTKLTEIQLIESDYMKTGKGGRPGRVYKAAAKGLSLSFPRKEDSLLLGWTLQVIEQLGADAIEPCKTISYKDGYNYMQALTKDNLKTSEHLTFDQKLQLLSTSASMMGYIPTIEQTADYIKIIFAIHHCPFSTSLPNYSHIICTLHESYLKGQMDALFTVNDFVHMENILHNCDYCKYEINVTETK